MSEVSDDRGRIEELERLLFRRISSAVADAVSPTLYHYTDAGGFFGILTSRALRASSFRGMSDTSEFSYGVRLIQEQCQNRPGRVFDFINLLVGRAEADFDFFIACFSDKTDDLSQWRAFRRDSCGFAFEFETEELEKRLAETTPPEGSLRLEPVIYNEDEQQRRIRKLLDRADEYADGLGPDGQDKVARRVATALVGLSCRLKNWRFESEREHRIILRLRSDSLVPHVNERFRLYVDLMASLVAFSAVWVGPGGRELGRAVDQRIKNASYSGIPVRFSEIPER